MSAADWIALFGHFLGLSLLAVGGAIATAPEMHRYLVDEQHWISDSQFSASIAIAQAAPGPNILFIALLGWNTGLQQTGSMVLGLWAVALCMTGMLLPSTVLTYLASSWGQRNRELRAVRAFRQGLVPIVIGLLMSTGWLLATRRDYDLSHWPLWLIAAVTAVLVWRTRIHLLWLLGAGAALGWFGLL